MLDSRAFHWGISNQVLNKINHKTFLHKPEYNFLMTFKTSSFLNVSAKISTENAIEQTCRRNQWWIKLPSTSYKYYSHQYLMISVTDIWWSLTPMNQSLIKYILRNRERNFHKIFFFFKKKSTRAYQSTFFARSPFICYCRIFHMILLLKTTNNVF